MKKIFTFIIAMFFVFAGFAQEEVMTFKTEKQPNETIRLWIQAHSSQAGSVWIDFNGNGVQDSEETITELNGGYYNYPITTDFIKIYGKISVLYAFNNKITEMDTSKNPYLTNLRISNNLIHTLNVSGNASLLDLRCPENNLKELDLSNNQNLVELYCYDNQLTELDLSTHIYMTSLSCYQNNLTKLSLPSANFSKLYRIGLFSNKLQGQAMDDVVHNLANLPVYNLGELYIFDSKAVPADENVATTVQVNIATGKKWEVFDYNGDGMEVFPYEGVPVSINENSNTSYKVWSKDGIIYYSGLEMGTSITLYDLNGNMLYNGSQNSKFSIPVKLEPGVYILQIDGEGQKIMVK